MKEKLKHKKAKKIKAYTHDELGTKQDIFVKKLITEQTRYLDESLTEELMRKADGFHTSSEQSGKEFINELRRTLPMGKLG